MEHLKDDLKIIFQCFGSEKSRIKKRLQVFGKDKFLWQSTVYKLFSPNLRAGSDKSRIKKSL